MILVTFAFISRPRRASRKHQTRTWQKFANSCGKLKSVVMEYVVDNFTIARAEARVAANPELRLLGWNVPPEELKHIPEHWLTFQEPEASLH